MEQRSHFVVDLDRSSGASGARKVYSSTGVTLSRCDRRNGNGTRCSVHRTSGARLSLRHNSRPRNTNLGNFARRGTHGRIHRHSAKRTVRASDTRERERERREALPKRTTDCHWRCGARGTLLRPPCWASELELRASRVTAIRYVRVVALRELRDGERVYMREYVYLSTYIYI